MKKLEGQVLELARNKRGDVEYERLDKMITMCMNYMLEYHRDLFTSDGNGALISPCGNFHVVDDDVMDTMIDEGEMNGNRRLH